MGYQSSPELRVLWVIASIAGVTLLAAVGMLLLVRSIPQVTTYNLHYTSNTTFNNFTMYSYSLYRCVGPICLPLFQDYICSYKVEKNTKCIVLENQIVCEGGVVCYKYNGMFFYS